MSHHALEEPAVTVWVRPIVAAWPDNDRGATPPHRAKVRGSVDALCPARQHGEARSSEISGEPEGKPAGFRARVTSADDRHRGTARQLTDDVNAARRPREVLKPRRQERTADEAWSKIGHDFMESAALAPGC